MCAATKIHQLPQANRGAERGASLTLIRCRIKVVGDPLTFNQHAATNIGDSSQFLSTTDKSIMKILTNSAAELRRGRPPRQRAGGSLWKHAPAVHRPGQGLYMDCRRVPGSGAISGRALQKWPLVRRPSCNASST